MEKTQTKPAARPAIAFTHVDPPVPTFARWRDLRARFPGVSVLRQLEYDAIEATPLAGRILDIGGGDNARYADHLPKSIRLESVNIDPAISPTHLIDAAGRFPITDDTFDGAVCLNTLEHVYDSLHTLRETHRVLKPGATVHITVPWIFRIHAHPDDYFRATPSWWRETLSRTGFSQASLMPLVWGRYTTAGTISGYRGIVPKGWQEGWSQIKDVLYARLNFPEGTYSGRRGERICAVSVGWLIRATK